MRSSLRFSKQCCSVLLTNRSPLKEAVSGRNDSRDSCLPDRGVPGMYCNTQMVQLSGGRVVDQVLFCLVELEKTYSAIFINPILLKKGFPGGSNTKEFACNAEDLGSIPGLGRSPEGRHGNPPQYSCQNNRVDRGPGGLHSTGLQRVGQTEQLTVILLRKSSLFTNTQCGLWHLFRDSERQWPDR